MVDFAKLRKEILLAAESATGDEEDDSVSIIQASGWRKELDNLPTTASLSLGAGLLGASIFDAIKNRDGSPMFVEPWRTMVIFSGASLFGFGLGRLTRGNIAQREAENYERVLTTIEEEQEEKEEKDAEENEGGSKSNLSFLSDPMDFHMVPSHTSMNVIGDYGPAIGQSAVSYQYGGY
tara:strand:+ start:399 stop:935 length:537 start_codon:yes stop_codon:yes gene_type:complete